MAEGGLSGLRVVDITQGVAGPYCTKLLADFGAEVIKVEPPGGDVARSWGPFVGGQAGTNASALSNYLNTNKASVALDLTTPAGRGALRRLLASADALVGDLGPASLSRLGLTPAGRKRLNPRLVVVSLSPFGESGPYRDWRASDLTLAAMADWMFPVGEALGEPLKSPGRMLGACLPGLFTAAALMAVLLARERHGSVQHIELPILEAMLVATRYDQPIYAVTGNVVTRVGPMLSPTYRYAEAKDGHVAVCATNLAHWESICALMGMEPLLEDPRLATALQRRDNGNLIIPPMDAWLGARGREGLFHELQAWRLPSAKVCRPSETWELPQLQERGVFVDLESPAGRFRAPGRPFSTSAGLWRQGRAPALGEHTEAVLAQPPASPPRAHPRRAPRSGLPLEGVRVLDLSMIWAGPLAGLLLADLGAEVIKVESMQRPDPWRAFLSKQNASELWNASPAFNSVQRNKLDITLNLADPRGQGLFKRLVRVSDVVLENYTPRVMEQFGLSYDRLRLVNPNIVMTSISGMGSTGPWAQYTSFATVAEALAGVGYLTREKDSPPVIHQTWPADSLAALNAACAILVALHHRERTGEGQRLEIAQLEVTVHGFADALLAASVGGQDWEPAGNYDPALAPYGCYPARGDDQWVAISVASDAEWARLGETMGNPSWCRDPRYATIAGRNRLRDELRGHLSEWTKRYDKRELAALLQAHGVTAGPVLGPADTLADPHLRERGFWQHVDQPVMGAYPQTGFPFRLSQTPLSVRHLAPALGQHNGQMLGDLLGLAPQELKELAAAQVIGERPLVPIV